MPAAVNAVSNAAVNFASRSRSSTRSPSALWPRVMTRFRACCATQALVGCGVTPTAWTWRVASSMKNRMESTSRCRRLPGRRGVYRTRPGDQILDLTRIQHVCRSIDAETPVDLQPGLVDRYGPLGVRLRYR